MNKKQNRVSPLGSKICAYGCGNEFQPGRKDQRFLDSYHANHDYNKRSKKKNELKELVKDTLNKNNKLLKDLYKLN